MVVTAHPLATYVGQRILRQGGNAADAAVATAIAGAVVRPSMNSIGGRNQILVRLPSGDIHGIDGTTQVPEGYDAATAPKAAYGYATIGVPGALAGLMRLHGEHGSLPLATVMAPAIEYAENGFRLLPGQARFHESNTDRLAESEGARGVYLKADGSAYGVGEMIRHLDLAKTYRKIVDGGAEIFYRGEIAATMASDIQANGGFVTGRSLADYEAVDARIVRGSYRGYELVAMDVPASGAIAIQSLQIMENFERAEYTAVEWATITAQALALSIPDLRRLGSDTAAARATAKSWAASQAEKIRLTATAPTGG
jgi:gamma-glutamyltranspeptidase/glutathione hydrolase